MSSIPKFEQYVNMCRNAAHTYSKKYGVEYDELEGQAFLIYVEALSKWEPHKATFSTFLTWRLKTLGDYCKTEKRASVGKKPKQDEVARAKKEGRKPPQTMARADWDNKMMGTIPGREEHPGLAKLLQKAACAVSADAYEVLKWVLHRRWDGRKQGNPSVITARRVFGYEWEWPRDRVDVAWAELSKLYNGGGFAAL